MSKDNPCRTRRNHWFSAPGRPGDVREFCVRPGCAARNPKWEAYKRKRAIYDRFIEDAVEMKAAGTLPVYGFPRPSQDVNIPQDDAQEEKMSKQESV